MDEFYRQICFMSLGFAALFYPSETKIDTWMRVAERFIFWGITYSIYTAIPSLISWFQTVLDMKEYQTRVSDLEYKIDLLQDRVQSLEKSKVRDS